MKVLVVGGTFDKDGGKQSSVAAQFKDALGASVNSVNGGHLGDLEAAGKVEYLKPFDVVIWMPNVPNDVVKQYPRKKVGATLICSKVMRDGYTRLDSVGRIFKMHGNAVIEIERDKKNGKFGFTLVDALGNNRGSSKSIDEMVVKIQEFVEWSKASVRVRSAQVGKVDAEILAELTKAVAYKVENSSGGRYFGNASTRCSRMFPSARSRSNLIMVSPRNIDKRYIEADDFVYSFEDPETEETRYFGSRKPSVDTPVQLKIYSKSSCFSRDVNVMIHGHSYIEDWPTTESMLACGDMREAVEIFQLMRHDVKCQRSFSEKGYMGLNLKGHGFLLIADSFESMQALVDGTAFVNRSFEK